MADYKIRCEIVDAGDGGAVCTGAGRMKKNDVYTIGLKTPEPAGICSKAFMAIYPVYMALRFTEEIPLEKGRGYVDVTCPDGQVIFRLSRIK